MTPSPPMSRLKLTTVMPYAILLAEVLVFYRHVLFYDGFVIPWDRMGRMAYRVVC